MDKDRRHQMCQKTKAMLDTTFRSASFYLFLVTHLSLHPDGIG